MFEYRIKYTHKLNNENSTPIRLYCDAVLTDFINDFEVNYRIDATSICIQYGSIFVYEFYPWKQFIVEYIWFGDIPNLISLSGWETT